MDENTNDTTDSKFEIGMAYCSVLSNKKAVSKILPIEGIYEIEKLALTVSSYLYYIVATSLANQKKEFQEQKHMLPLLLDEIRDFSNFYEEQLNTLPAKENIN